MKKIVFIMPVTLILAFYAATGVAQQKNQSQPGKGYNPQVTYPGTYKSTLLFYRPTSIDIWQRKPYQDRLRNVSCQDALNHLNSEGTWKGTLNPDGSCGPSSVESPQWATGNWLNFEQLVGMTGN